MPLFIRCQSLMVCVDTWPLLLMFFLQVVSSTRILQTDGKSPITVTWVVVIHGQPGKSWSHNAVHRVIANTKVNGSSAEVAYGGTVKELRF